MELRMPKFFETEEWIYPNEEDSLYHLKEGAPKDVEEEFIQYFSEIFGEDYVKENMIDGYVDANAEHRSAMSLFGLK